MLFAPAPFLTDARDYAYAKWRPGIDIEKEQWDAFASKQTVVHDMLDPEKLGFVSSLYHNSFQFEFYRTPCEDLPGDESVLRDGNILKVQMPGEPAPTCLYLLGSATCNAKAGDAPPEYCVRL